MIKQFSENVSLAKWLSVCLQTKWLWVQVLLLSFKFQISRLFRARSSFLFNFSLILFSVGLTNSYSKLTNKYQLKQKDRISIDFKMNI